MFNDILKLLIKNSLFKNKIVLIVEIQVFNKKEKFT